MTLKVERISAITLKVANMEIAVKFYGDVLGMEIIYGGKHSYFSSLRMADAEFPILNLEQGSPIAGWGRVIFYVADVDAFWTYLKAKGLNPHQPQDATWGERYFHMHDPDGNELSFAHPL